MSTIFQISHLNINKIKFEEPKIFDQILLDTIYTCNLHCMYCHNERYSEKLKEEDLINFIETQVLSVTDFQIGCAMEPTMDKRLTKFAKIVANSKAKPSGMFRLQTNATLIDRHNVDELIEAGINKFTISLDTVDVDVHKELRGGSDLEKIIKNIKMLRQNYSNVPLHLVTTVNKLNQHLLDDLCSWAIDNNITFIDLRKMFYFSDSKIIKEHEKMKSIVSDNLELDEIVISLRSKYPQIDIYFNNEEKLKNTRELNIKNKLLY
jgi:MoaA/NifB/PqqE/SkfB family radical SAM enzyme